ncbi:MAG: hypothetical protein HQK56_02220 [Deltaproteobacteria bacterium]|nr:hypothetical protein [Deltaproteobacteria bacterium]
MLLFPWVGYKSTADAGEPVQKKKVATIRYRLPPDNFAGTVASFKEEMTARGYKEGKNIEYVDLLTSTGDQSSAPEAEAFVEKNKGFIDAYLTCGWISMVVRNKIKGTNIPQVASPLYQPVAVNLVGGPLDKPSKSNIAVVYLMYPPVKTIRLLKMVLPSAKKYGIVYHSQVPADQYFKKWHEEVPVAAREGLEFIYFDLNDGVDKVMAQIKQSGVDAFGGGVAIRRPEFAGLFKMGIPVVGHKDTIDLEKIKPTDELIGHYNPLDACGVQAAVILSDVFGGKNIGDILPQPASKQMVYVNLDAAKRLGINIPTKVLGYCSYIIK